MHAFLLGRVRPQKGHRLFDFFSSFEIFPLGDSVIKETASAVTGSDSAAEDTDLDTDSDMEDSDSGIEDTDSTVDTTDSVIDTVDLVIDATVFDDANSFVKDSDDDDDGVFEP